MFFRLTNRHKNLLLNYLFQSARLEDSDRYWCIGDVKEDIIKSYQLVQEKEEENEDHLLED